MSVPQHVPGDFAGIGQTPLAQADSLLLDLDGVVYRGKAAVPHAVEALAQARDQGARLGYITNNAARPPEVVAEHLTELGLDAVAEDVVTSAQAAAAMLAKRVPSGSPVLAVGGPGVAAALTEVNLQPVLPAQFSQGQSVKAVMQGFGPEVNWQDLATASYAIAAGAVWVATNTDRTIPRAGGIAPGNGTLVDAVSAATGQSPPAAGKPEPAIIELAIARMGVSRPLVVGDRLDTDIAAANAAGLPSMLVLTGVSSVDDVLDASASMRPTYIVPDLRWLHRSVPALGIPLPSSAGSADDAEAGSAALDEQVWAIAQRVADAGSRPAP